MSSPAGAPLGRLAALCTAICAFAVPASPVLADEIAGGNQTIAVVHDEAAGDHWLQLPGQVRRSDAAATLRLGNDRRRQLIGYPAFAWVGPSDEVGWITALSSEGADPLSLHFSSEALIERLDAAAPQVELELSAFQGPGDVQLYETTRPRGGNSHEVPPHASSPFRLGTGLQRDGTPQSPTAVQPEPSLVSNLVQRFDAPGMYCLTFTASFTLAGATTPETAGGTLRVAVGDSVAADAPCGSGSSEPAWSRPPGGEINVDGHTISPSTDPGNQRDFLALPGMTSKYYVSPGTVRVSNSHRSALPADGSFAWIGDAGEPGWLTEPASPPDRLHLQFDSHLADELLGGRLQIALQQVEGPGRYQTYLTDADAELAADAAPRTENPFQIGTGEQRDGSPQPASATLRFDGTGSHNFNVHRFTEPGMYCITYAISYTVVRAGEEVPGTVTDTMRVAVGDSVALDAACGTASVEPPYRRPGEPDPDAETIIRSGHGDLIYPELETTPEGTELRLRAHHDAYGTLEWDDLVVAIPDTAQLRLPSTYTSRADYSFIGAAGSMVWNSPEATNGQQGPWIGMATQSPSLDPLANSHRFDIRLDAVTGADGGAAPGEVALWANALIAPSVADTVRWSTRKGLPASVEYLNNLHSHFNWSFTHRGVYCLAFAVVTRLPDGRRQEATEQLTLAVGSDVDATAVVPCGEANGYPSPAPRPTLAPAGTRPHVITGGIAHLTAALDDSGPGPALSTALELDDAYAAGPATRHAIDDVILHVPAGYRPTYQLFESRGVGDLRERTTSLGWSTTDVPAAAIDGDVRWELSDVRGPGELSIDFRDLTGQTIDTAAGRDALSLPPRARGTGPWTVTRPGKYCIDLRWSATTATGRAVTGTDTLTLVADGPLDPADGRDGRGPDGRTRVYDGPMFEHEPGTLTTTCADGGQPTNADEVPLPGGEPRPRPSSPWEVANGSKTASGATILNDGHVDVASLLDVAVLDTKIKDDTSGGEPVYRDPEQTVLQLLPGAKTTVGGSGQFAFLGAVGAPLWQVGQTQQSGLIWPGWSTESIAPAATTGGIEWTLDAVDGPGRFSIYQVVGFGDVAHVLSSTQLGTPYTIPKATHAHGNWAFTAEGVYCLAMTRSATLAGGGRVSDSFTLAVAVGEVDPRTVDPSACAGRKAPEPEPEPRPDEKPRPGDPSPDLRPLATTVSAKAITQVYGRQAKLTAKLSARVAGGSITIRVGSKTLTGAVRGGRATVLLPRRSLRPGRRQLTIAYSGVPGRFAPARGRATVRVVKATPRLTLRRVRSTGGVAAYRVTVSATGVRPTGRVTVAAGRVQQSARLDRRGTAIVKLALPRSIRARRVSVTYGGDRYVARVRAAGRR